jgi:heat-inducible transcriptional repressor
MEELTARKEGILRAVVVEYVESAEPVGSSYLVERYVFGISPATVRNELSEMSERGYLEQPHTSAGRIPSDAGYRYFVDRLAQPSVEKAAVKRVRDALKDDRDLEELLVETCKALSSLTRQMSIGATLDEKKLGVRSVNISAVTHERALATVVFSNGIVENRLIPAKPSLTLGDLHVISAELTRATAGRKIHAINRIASPTFEGLKPDTRAFAATAWKGVKAICKSMTGGKVVTEGAQHLFAQPEFQRDMAALGDVISALASEEMVHEVLEEPKEGGTSVKIGQENARSILQGLAIISSRFYAGTDEVGAIAIAGPMRMRYSDTIPLVETAAKALSEALSRMTR